MKPSPYRVREAVGLLDAEPAECASSETPQPM